MSDTAINWVVLAHLLRPQGRKGELLAELLTDFPDRFTTGMTACLAPPGFRGAASEVAAVELTSSWLPHGRNEGRIVLGFGHIRSIDQAESVAGYDVLVPESERVALTEDVVYTDSLIGCVLFNRDVRVGVVSAVQFMTTPDGKRRLEDAAPLLSIELEGGEALVPFAKRFLMKLDVAEKHLWMNLPEGLLELNLSKKRDFRSRPSEPHRETDG